MYTIGIKLSVHFAVETSLLNKRAQRALGRSPDGKGQHSKVKPFTEDH